VRLDAPKNSNLQTMWSKKTRGGFSILREVIKNISRVASHAGKDGVHGGGQVGKETQSKS